MEVDRLKERIAQAEREAQAARDEIKWEKENSEKMLQTAMQMAAAAGSRASEESSVRLSELQEKLSAKEREVVEANAALQVRAPSSQQPSHRGAQGGLNPDAARPLCRGRRTGYQCRRRQQPESRRCFRR